MTTLATRFSSIVALSILGLLAISPGLQAHESFRVLAIHAYSQEYPWTKSQHQGFVEVLSKNSRVPVSISTEYLDTKRRSYNDDYARHFRRYLQTKYTGYKPNIIYVTDDYGYQFARHYLLKLYPDAPVIFSGVDDYNIIADIEALPIRGVFERKDISKNLDLLKSLDVADEGILVVGDGSSTYQVIENEIKHQLINYPEIHAEFLVENNMENLVDALATRQQKYLFLTSIGEMKGHTGLLLNPETVVSEIVDTDKFTIFTMEDSYFYDGVLGGYVTSGELQGAKAAGLTLGLQLDDGVHQIDNILESPNTYIFDKAELNQLGFSLPPSVEAEAVFYNIPPSFYERNRSAILVLSTLLIVTSITIFGFIIVLRIKKKEDERKREEKRTAQLERYQNALITWSEARHENIQQAFCMAMEISSRTLDVNRVGIWLYDDARTSIECRSMYIEGRGHSSGEILERDHFPQFFATLDSGRRIAVSDASTDPATCELSETYLARNDICSMLGAPVFYDGDIIGMISLEHTTELRKWTVNEQEFTALIASDISLALEIDKRKVIEKNLEHQAYHDSLTGLPNRALLLDRTEQAIAHAKRNGSLLAVLFLDLDNFKQVNDSLGHSVGDEVLVTVSRMLKKAIREMDTIARLGGDEFTILLSDFDKAEEISEIMAKLFEVLRSPLQIKGSEFFVTTSIGVSVYPDNGDTPEILLRNADTAMYRAKEKGRNGFEFYTEDMTEIALEKVQMIANLNRALEQNEFEVYYQPQYDIRHKKMTGVEALIRWHHPTLGLVYPEQFLPVAEESGLIVALDRWVMHQGLQQLKLWGKLGFQPGRLSLNLTMQQIDQPDFLHFLIELMEASDCDGASLGFEITEGQLMKDPIRTIEVLSHISDLGIKIAVDDFGTGYSSLAYLKKLPVDTLKIDKEFIRDLPGDGDDISIVKSIIALAKSMRIDVLAEGVETIEQLEFLDAEGCGLIQGFLLAEPKAASEIPASASYPLKPKRVASVTKLKVRANL